MCVRDESSYRCLVQLIIIYIYCRTNINIRCGEKVSEANFEIKNIYTRVLYKCTILSKVLLENFFTLIS